MNDETGVDERVERTLAGLREAEVPAGLEERVLRAVGVREAAEMRKLVWWPEWLRGLGAYGLGAVAVLMVMAGLAWRGFEPRADVVGKKLAVRVEAPAPADRVTVVARPHPGRVKLSRGWGTRIRSGVGHEDAVASAVSYPAPPLPLTEQERLLLRVVHGHDPVQVAMLDGVSSVAKFAEDRAEFQRFFKSVPTSEVSSPKSERPEVKPTPTEQGKSK